MENPFDILELPRNSNIETVKKKYKELALLYHPDKLHNIDNIEKEIKIEKFKKISVAYGKIINGDNDYKIDDELFTPDVWKETWEYIFNSNETKDIIKDAFYDVASVFLKNKIKPKTYYKPSTNYIKHNISLPISYTDIFLNNKRKLRLILTNIPEPVFIDIYCNKNYPIVTKYFIDDDNNEHEIKIELTLDNNIDNINNTDIINYDNFYHNIKEDGSIDIIKYIEISFLDFINGCDKEIKYIDNSILNINIPGFENTIIKHGFGLRNGDLIIKLIIKNLENIKWTGISIKDKAEMIRILNAL